MNRAMRVAASALGGYAGLIAMEHGYFELSQGHVAPGGLLFNAMGPPCQAEEVWHACFPALTLLPNLRIAGILTLVVGLAMATWAAAFVARKRGGLVLFLLAVASLFVGGGFVATFIGVFASVAGALIPAPLSKWRARLPGGVVRFLSALWPWPLVLLLVWFPVSWVLGYFFDSTLLQVGVMLFLLFDLGLPFLTILTALARDM